jgi:glycine/D-amino acid oxidase-like deaminating enzyme
MHVVIVGGGAVGSSAAYHLASNPRFSGSVTVIERDPTYRIASSSLSASSIRTQFSNPVNIGMSQFGMRFLKAAPEALAVDGDRPALSLHERGYLFLASEAGAEAMRANHAVQTAEGADIELMTPAQIVARYPWINPDGIALGAHGRSGEGWFDGPGLLAALRRKARSLGVTYIARDAVGVRRSGDRVTHVALDDGAEVAADVVVNSAGPWSARVAAWVGIDLPVRARKRMVYVVACKTPLPGCPMLIDCKGNFFRPEGPSYITGRSPGEGEADPDFAPLEVEEEMWMAYVWPELAHRIPATEELKRTGAWAGYYEYNTFDHNGVVGLHPDCANMVFATGFSGHGMQHSPASGRGVSELIVEGGFSTLDLSPLGWKRLIDGTPLVEANIW